MLPQEPQTIHTPTEIDRITVILQTDILGGESIKGQFEIKDQSGNVIRVAQYNLADYITAQQINQLRAFMASTRNRAVTEILPPV